MAWEHSTDPFYIALLAEIADLEWQVVEEEFSEALKQGLISEISPSAQ